LSLGRKERTTTILILPTEFGQPLRGPCRWRDEVRDAHPLLVLVLGMTVLDEFIEESGNLVKSLALRS
jgi:hypothetical protein